MFSTLSQYHFSTQLRESRSLYAHLYTKNLTLIHGSTLPDHCVCLSNFGSIHQSFKQVSHSWDCKKYCPWYNKQQIISAAITLHLPSPKKKEVKDEISVTNDNFLKLNLCFGLSNSKLSCPLLLTMARANVCQCGMCFGVNSNEDAPQEHLVLGTSV